MTDVAVFCLPAPSKSTAVRLVPHSAWLLACAGRARPWVPGARALPSQRTSPAPSQLGGKELLPDMLFPIVASFNPQITQRNAGLSNSSCDVFSKILTEVGASCTCMVFKGPLGVSFRYASAHACVGVSSAYTYMCMLASPVRMACFARRVGTFWGSTSAFRCFKATSSFDQPALTVSGAGVQASLCTCQPGSCKSACAAFQVLRIGN